MIRSSLFVTFIGEIEVDVILGLRAGEALGCIYSDVTEGGCGTSHHCRECGAATAILASLNGDLGVQECRITLHEDNTSLDLRVMSSSLEDMEEKYAVFSIIDIAHEKRREVLERIFLHDVKNTAGGLQGFSRLLTEGSEDESGTFKKMIRDLSDKLLDEINSYSQLAQAEDNRLNIRPAAFSTLALLSRVKNLFMNHNVASDRELDVDPEAVDVMMTTDETILGRIIGNMTKNALEAIDPGNLVTLSCARENGQIRFTVHNPGTIPPDTQLQIFQRSFSTKGTGRGLGTYSVKLLSEQYLKGKVGFTTSENEGTTFYGIYPLILD